MAHISNLEQAAALDLEKWLQTLLEEAPAYAFSEKYKKFRIKLFDKMRGDKYHRFTKKATVFIIIAAIILSLAVATVAASVGKDFLLKHFKGYANVEISDSESGNDYVDSLTLNYIPDGFKRTQEDISDMGITYSYQKNGEWFDITKNSIKSGLTIDAGSKLEEFSIGLNKYLYSISDGVGTMMWNNGSYVYYITGTITRQEMIDISLHTDEK